jgi:hypothetical protein
VSAVLADGAGYARMSRQAVETASRYSLERWADAIRASLEGSWGPLESRHA